MSDLAAPPSKTSAPFNYAALDPALAADAQRIATRIRTRLRGSYIATGQDLLTMKERLGHGRFGVWLEAEFAMSDRTAQRYMGAAHLAAANSDMVSELPVMVIEALAAPSLSETARAVCIGRIKAGVAMTPRGVAMVAREVRYTQQKDAQAIKSAPRRKATRAALQERQEATRLQNDVEATRSMLAQQRVIEILADALGSRQDEVTQLLRAMRRHSINPTDLLEAISRQAGGA